ncbi:hypothetical protein Tco_1348563 [Tanacetum coccineum]
MYNPPLIFQINYYFNRFDTSAGNPVKEILLKLNLPDHRSILTDSKMEVKDPKANYQRRKGDIAKIVPDGYKGGFAFWKLCSCDSEKARALIETCLGDGTNIIDKRLSLPLDMAMCSFYVIKWCAM